MAISIRNVLSAMTTNIKTFRLGVAYALGKQLATEDKTADIGFYGKSMRERLEDRMSLPVSLNKQGYHVINYRGEKRLAWKSLSGTFYTWRVEDGS